MTGNGKTDKKFHTLQHQISVVFICLLLLSIFTITLINGLFLEKYYVSKKVEVLEEAKEVLSQMNLDDILQYDTDIEEDKKGATDEISDEIERSSSRNNLTWIIVNEENSGYYYWGENNMAKMLRSKLFGYINNLDQDMQHSRVLKKTDTCTMWQVHDRFAGMEYVECWGQFDNGYYFLIRSPLESIKESASISNSFYFIVGIIIIVVSGTDQSAHQTLHECSLLLGTDRVKVQNALVGGGFGGKEDMTVQHLAALLTYATKKPVKMKLTRAESLLVHPKRHPFYMDMTMGCDENGNIMGVKAKVASDTGAFASLGGPVLERACTHAAGPYHYENFEIEGTAYYTNNPPAGAFRGFGVTQTCFATETLLNMMADKVGITPWEIRYRNAIRPGETLPNGQIVDNSTGLVETLEAVKKKYDAALEEGKPVGIGCAMKNAGVGVGIPDTGRVKLVFEKDKKLHIYSGASCIGQGLGTVLTQMVVTNTDLKHEDIVYERSNTWFAPDSGTTSGSRQTLVTGEACRRACDKVMEDRNAGKTIDDVIGKIYYGEYLAKTDPLGANVPNPVSHVAYGYATQMCILDKKTGKIEEMVAAHDVGKAVNPLSCEGQIEGGVVMSIGFALREHYPIDENCKPIDKYGSLGLFRSHEIPKIDAIVVDKPGLNVACGAIGIGEITSIPTAPAIADAYFRWNGERQYSLPLTGTPYERKC